MRCTGDWGGLYKRRKGDDDRRERAKRLTRTRTRRRRRTKAPIPLRRLPRNFPVRGSFGEVGVMEFGLKGTSRVCRGRHGEVGIVEFGQKTTHTRTQMETETN